MRSSAPQACAAGCSGRSRKCRCHPRQTDEMGAGTGVLYISYLRDTFKGDIGGVYR